MGQFLRQERHSERQSDPTKINQGDVAFLRPYSGRSILPTWNGHRSLAH